jgi:3-(3-hydroxy-phenyl)propionate hydroxylase
MGQGMCAGIRDVANLAWKLAIAARADAADTLLDSYQSERHPNAREYIITAVRLGGLINTSGSKAALQAAFPRPEGGARMESITPPLGPAIGKGPLAGRLFGHPRLADGRLIDEVTQCQWVLVADANILADIELPDTIALVATDTAPDAAAHLARFGIAAALLRPDRYIFGTADTSASLRGLLDDARSWFGKPIELETV